MKLKAQIDAAQISNMELTISLTLSVQQWRELMRQLPAPHPSWKVSEAISYALGHVTKSTSLTFHYPPTE